MQQYVLNIIHHIAACVTPQAALPVFSLIAATMCLFCTFKAAGITMRKIWSDDDDSFDQLSKCLISYIIVTFLKRFLLLWFYSTRLAMLL